MSVQFSKGGQAANPAWPAPETLDLFRAVSDLVRHEVSRLRGHAIMEKLEPGTRLDTEGGDAGSLGLKSLDLMDVASAASDMFGIGKAGLDDLLLARRTLGDWTALAARALSAASANGEASIVFQTSGTTGQPKLVSHPLWRLAEEVSFWATAFADRRRFIAAVPGHHIYGFLFTCLLPSKLEVEVVDCRYSMPGSVIKSLQAGDLIVGHPDFWTRLASANKKQGLTFPAGIWGVSSTGPLDQGAANTLPAQGLDRLFEIYGSTETLALGWRLVPAQQFSLLPLWVRRGDIVHWKEGFTAPVQDKLDWRDAHHFAVRGRLDGMVQLAGTNVNIAHLSAAAKAVPGVTDCQIKSVSTENGTRLVAEITTSSSSVSPGLEAAARQALDTHTPTGASIAIRFNCNSEAQDA